MQKVLNDQIWKICVKVQEWPDGETSNSSRGPTLSQVSATVIIIIIDIAIVVICTDIHWWLWMIFSCRATQIWDYPSGTTRTQTWRWVLNMSMINAIALSYISAMYWILKVGFGLKRQNTWHRLLSPQDTLDLKKQDTFDLNKNKDVIDQITSTVWCIQGSDIGFLYVVKSYPSFCIFPKKSHVCHLYSLLWFICPALSPKILAVMF